jgi:hypothetical protein
MTTSSFRRHDRHGGTAYLRVLLLALPTSSSYLGIVRQNGMRLAGLANHSSRLYLSYKRRGGRFVPGRPIVVRARS